jgi:hypothetical protein
MLTHAVQGGKMTAKGKSTSRQSSKLEDRPQPSLLSWESLKVHYFYLYSPVLLAILFYLLITAAIAFLPSTTYVTMYNMVILYVFASTWINMIRTNWWLNTILFVVSFFILLSSLSAAYESLREPLSGADLSSSLGPMLACIFLVPATGLMRLLFINKGEKQNEQGAGG